MHTMEHKGVNPIAVGLTGMAIGALGVAAAYALTDRKTRDKINDKIDDVSAKGKEKVAELKQKIKAKKQEVDMAMEPSSDL
jgi:hypothetical protein